MTTNVPNVSPDANIERTRQPLHQNNRIVGDGIVGDGIAPSSGSADELVQNTNVISPRDRIRWGPVWAGVIATFVTFVVLEILCVGLGLVTPVVTNGNQNPGVTSAVSSAIVGLIAFFVGGWIAQATSAVRGGDAGILNGMMVWALALSLILILSLLGLSSVFGALGNIVGQFFSAGRTITNPGAPSVNAQQIADTARGAAWGTFVSLILSAAAAALGGLLASRANPIGRLSRLR